MTNIKIQITDIRKDKFDFALSVGCDQCDLYINFYEKNIKRTVP